MQSIQFKHSELSSMQSIQLKHSDHLIFSNKILETQNKIRKKKQIYISMIKIELLLVPDLRERLFPNY